MNVVFWSHLTGHGATTSNMACLAIMSSLMYNYKTISFQSGYSYNNLNQSFIGKDNVTKINTVNEEFAYYMGKGIDGVLNSIYIDSFLDDKIEDYSIEILKGVSYYLPSTTKSNEDLFNERMSNNVFGLLTECNKFFDLTFIDNQSRVRKVSDKFFVNADICVININQNPDMISETMKEFEKLNCNCKVIYLIGRYDQHSKFNTNYITKKFHINKEDIGVIPYCSDFLESIMSGKTKEFLKSNLSCKKRDKNNYYFMQEVIKSTEKLLRNKGVEVG